MNPHTHWPEAGGIARIRVPLWVNQKAPLIPWAWLAYHVLAGSRPDRWSALSMGWPIYWSQRACPLCSGERPSPGAWRICKDGRCATCI